MADPHLQEVGASQEGGDYLEPVPQSKLKELSEMTRIVSSAYRHVEHQQAVEQVAGVAAAAALADDRALSADPKSPSSPWMASSAQRTPSLPLSLVDSSEGSDSVVGGLMLRTSAGAGSTEGGDLARTDSESVNELINLPPSLDSALRINMALQRSFREKINKLEASLVQNVERQAKLKKEVYQARRVREQQHQRDGKLRIRITHFCVPYFRSRTGMPALMNEDAKDKLDNGYIDLYLTKTRTWLTSEREALDDTVRKVWRDQELKMFNMTMREKERRLEKLDPENEKDKVQEQLLESEIKDLSNKIRILDKLSHKRVVPKRWEELLDWHTIAATAFDGHRTAEECRLQWENLLHPEVNSEVFTEIEDFHIQKAVSNSRSKIPDWDTIAKKMNTGRTGFMVMQRYKSFIKPALKPNRWSKKDSDKLLQVVSMLRVGNHIPWSQIHQHFVGYSRQQIQSRWRAIDPDVQKGNFTVEEDFLLIKGLHMFGLNFDTITHFLPGRILAQVRERYKRTILPSLAERPWTKEADDLLIRRCSVGSKNWRKMVMELPLYSACQIRARYHTIQVWQTISKTNMTPPPLFPISCTVNVDTINEIREAIMTESPDLKNLVDKSRKEIKMNHVVKELEERRLIIKERKAQNNLSKIKKVTDRRGRMAGTSVPRRVQVHSLVLTEFFIPQRPTRNFPAISFFSVQESVRVMSNTLQLRVSCPSREVEELTQRFPSLSFTSEDLSLAKSMACSRGTTTGNACASDCSACKPQVPEQIPLFPPCKTTLGTFKSLLVHRPKLHEMARKEFLLYKYSKRELLMLEAQYKGKRVPRKRINYTLQQPEPVPEGGNLVVPFSHAPHAQVTLNQSINPLAQVTSQSETEASQDESESEAPEEPQRKRMKIHITHMDGKVINRRRSKVKQEATSPVKEYSRGQSSKSKVGGIPESAGNAESSAESMPSFDAPFTLDEGTPAEAAEQVIVLPSCSTSTPPTTAGPLVYKMEINGQVITNDDVICPERQLSAEEERKREASDNLLFQRMFALFYWPAIMTRAPPTQKLISEVNETITSGKLKKPQKEKKLQTFYDKDDLNIKQQVAYISHLSDEQQKMMEEASSMKESLVSAVKSSSPKKNPVPPNATEESEEDDTMPQEDVDNNEDSSNASGSKEQIPAKVLGVHRRKQRLKSLRRSLVMKVIWDARRKGCYEQRTSKRDKRTYVPRGSRTRDCVRRDMIKEPEPPKPWNFPLDGPMKVQPQVPQLPSEELIIHALADDAYDSDEEMVDDPDNARDSPKGIRKDEDESAQHIDSVMEGKPSVSGYMQSKMQADTKPGLDRSSLKRRSKTNHSQVSVGYAVADVHAPMNEEATPNSSSQREIAEGIDNESSDAGVEDGSQPIEETGNEAMAKGKSRGKKYAQNPRSKSTKGYQKILKEAIRRNNDDSEEAIHDPNSGEGIGSKEPVPENKARTPVSKESYQVSFHSLLEDDPQDNAPPAQQDNN